MLTNCWVFCDSFVGTYYVVCFKVCNYLLGSKKDFTVRKQSLILLCSIQIIQWFSRFVFRSPQSLTLRASTICTADETEEKGEASVNMQKSILFLQNTFLISSSRLDKVFVPLCISMRHFAPFSNKRPDSDNALDPNYCI